jgi:hypothetical protein
MVYARILLIILFNVWFACGLASANNLLIDNVTLEDRDPSAQTVVVQFDLTWDNSWRTKINHDAVWMTVRLSDPAVSPVNKILCDLSSSGLNPSGTSTGLNSSLEIYVPSDKKGAFIRPQNFGFNSSVASLGMRVTVDYASCGFASSDTVVASLLGIEMVYVPEGAFYAGDYGAGAAALAEGSADTDPWYISSESALSVSNPASNGYRYVSAGNTNETATGASFTLSADFPKGYGPFYAMKYEINEGQWVAFVNSLPSAAARANRDVTNAAHKNSDSVTGRNTVSCSGTPLTCSTDRPYRAMGYLSWMDVAAFLDWTALRPLTELEFEKLARGPLLPESGEFAWGTTAITGVLTLSGSSEDGTETVLTAGANAHFDNVLLAGGDTANGAGYQSGPLRNGIFATGSSGRESAGAGYYGAMELSGNLAERVVTIGNAGGRLFEGSHGDGRLATEAGYEGNASQTDWPGTDVITARGVTSGDGSGIRGGGFIDEASGARLRTSDRNVAANGAATAPSHTGGRGVRSHDGN